MSRLHELVGRAGRFARARPGVLLAATIAVFGAGGLLLRYGVEQGSQGTGFDGVPAPPALQEAIAGIFGDDRCIGVADAERMIQSKLEELGFGKWTIHKGAGADNAACVAAGLDAEAQEVELVMALGPDVQAALQAAREELLSNCRAKDDAAQMVESVLLEEGLEGWEVRTDGPIVGPADRIDEIERHVERGCWILSTTGWTAAGTPVVWLGGK
jgi:hypothetical protein